MGYYSNESPVGGCEDCEIEPTKRCAEELVKEGDPHLPDSEQIIPCPREDICQQGSMEFIKISKNI